MIRDQHRDLSQSLAELAEYIFAGRKRLKRTGELQDVQRPDAQPVFVRKQNELRLAWLVCGMMIA